MTMTMTEVMRSLLMLTNRKRSNAMDCHGGLFFTYLIVLFLAVSCRNHSGNLVSHRLKNHKLVDLAGVDKYTAWQYPTRQEQWLYGRNISDGVPVRPHWMLYPPVEFAVEMIGVENYSHCIDALENGAPFCSVDPTSCTTIAITRDKIIFHIYLKDCAYWEKDAGWTNPPDMLWNSYEP